MDRLTQHTRYGWQFSGLPTLALDLDSHETGIYNKAAQRLAQYESTGLEPDEIQKLQEKYDATIKALSGAMLEKAKK